MRHDPPERILRRSAGKLVPGERGLKIPGHGYGKKEQGGVI
jgi:hypothetical protein